MRICVSFIYSMEVAIALYFLPDSCASHATWRDSDQG